MTPRSSAGVRGRPARRVPRAHPVDVGDAPSTLTVINCGAGTDSTVLSKTTRSFARSDTRTCRPISRAGTE